jgi:hypothetical protein
MYLQILDVALVKHLRLSLRKFHELFYACVYKEISFVVDALGWFEDVWKRGALGEYS